jgi:hypothetical protein
MQGIRDRDVSYFIRRDEVTASRMQALAGMTEQSNIPAAATRAIRELCVGGEWACAHGDFAGLRHVAIRLAGYMSEPDRDELVALATACIGDPSGAALRWNRLQRKLHA